MIDISIVIPTFNRQNWIEGRMVSLERLLADSGIVYEVIISDNHSNPPVESCCPDPRSKRNVIVIKPERHLQKAEENLFFALNHCTGEYVWVLGDDDIPCKSGIDAMVSLVKSKKYDLMVFDSNRFLVNGAMINGNLANSAPGDLDSVGDFVRKYGFWFTIAGFSNSVFKRPSIEEIRLTSEILEVSPIYSHVIWLVAVFWGRPFRFETTPLVIYSENRRDHNTSDVWPRLALDNGVFATYYWTLGFVRQIKYLRNKVGMPVGWLNDVWDANGDGKWGPLLDTICFIFWNEIVSKPRIARAATIEEIREVSAFLLEENSKFEIFNSFLKSCDYDPANFHKIRKDVDAFITSILGNPLFDYYIYEYRNYNIYKLHGKFIAVPVDSLGNIAARLIRDTALTSHGDLLAGDSIETVKAQVDALLLDRVAENYRDLRIEVGRIGSSVNTLSGVTDAIRFYYVINPFNMIFIAIFKLMKRVIPRRFRHNLVKTA